MRGEGNQCIVWKEGFCFKVKNKTILNRKRLGFENQADAQLLEGQPRQRGVCCHLAVGEEGQLAGTLNDPTSPTEPPLMAVPRAGMTLTRGGAVSSPCRDCGGH